LMNSEDFILVVFLKPSMPIESFKVMGLRNSSRAISESTRSRLFIFFDKGFSQLLYKENRKQVIHVLQRSERPTVTAKAQQSTTEELVLKLWARKLIKVRKQEDSLGLSPKIPPSTP